MSDGLPPGWPHTQGPDGQVARRFNREPTCRPPQRINWIGHRDRFEQMWKDDVDVEVMSDFFECSTATIYAKASQWKLGRRRALGRGKAKGKKRRLPKHDPGNQRRFVGAMSDGGPRQGRVTLKPHDPRFRAGATIFPTTVIPAAELPRLLKSGHNSRKIGRVVTKGRWRGFPIFTLTLEERATCPRSCLEWATCYGNNMPFAQRIFDDGAHRWLWGELGALNAEHPAGFVVRLHVLGDFFSTAYVDFWRQALVDFPALRIFGFTARRPPDPIGVALVLLAAAEQERFAMRFSGAGYETHCAEVVDKPEDATGIRCPAETDENRSCATCGLCWSSTATISFVRH